MYEFEKAKFIKWMLGIVFLGLMLSGCFSLQNRDTPPPLNRQDKNAVAALERQEASGQLTSTESAMEKDSLTHAHGIKF